MESILINAQVSSRAETQVVAGSLDFYISLDTLHSYFNMLDHLAGINTICGWEACKEQILHHSKKLAIIHNKFRSHFQMVYNIHIYLQEGQSELTKVNLEDGEVN